MSWTKDNRTENFLDRLGTSYIYDTEIPMHALSEGWNINNASRPGDAIINDAVQEYAERMKQGEQPPAVIVIFQHDGSVFPVDGRQRLTAAIQRGWSHFNAYVLDDATKKIHVELIEIGANLNTNGAAPVRKEFVYERAAHMHTEHGISVQQIASDLGLRPEGISNHIIYTDTVKFLQEKGLPAKSMPKGTVLTLAQLNKEWWEKAPKETKEIIEIIYRAKLQNGLVREFVCRANKNCKGNKKRTTQMTGFKREMLSDSVVSQRLAGTKKRGPDTKVIENARKLRTVAIEARRAGIKLTDHQTKELVQAIDEGMVALRSITKQGTF